MAQILQQLFNGLALGSIYALIALGYTMVYGIIAMINFAYGEIYMFGAFTGLYLAVQWKANIYIAIVGAMLFTTVLGLVVELVAYRPLRRTRDAGRLSALISAIGASIFLSTLMVRIKGPSTQAFPDLVVNRTFTLGGASISLYQILIVGVAALLMILLELFIRYTRTGRAMRAVAQDADAAALMGVNNDLIVALTFAVGSALAGAGGVLAGIYFHAAQPYMGLMAGLKAFAAAVLGGIGSIPGAVVGGLIIGLAELLGVAAKLSQWKDAFAFAILIIVLLVKPSGLLGRASIKKV
ncbi:MAG: branched-chain amino acid ABC transporter permease [Symbiobacteriia bacterium]